MSSIGTGYDLSASQFSPDGRVFQVEYAQKAVENSGTAIGLKGKDGVVFAVEKLVQSKLYEFGANRRIFSADNHVGVAVAGLLADAKQIVETARTECADYRHQYGSNIPLKYLNDRVSMFMHAYTLYSAVRPFGCSAIIGSYDKVDGPSMFVVDSSGVSHGYYGCAIGKAKQSAKTEMEKLKLADMSCRELVKEAARIIYLVHDELKDKTFELELSWVGEATGGKHETVPKELFQEAEKFANSSLQDESDSDTEDALIRIKDERREDWICFLCCHVRTATISIGIWQLMLQILSLVTVAVIVSHPEIGDPRRKQMAVTPADDELETPLPTPLSRTPSSYSRDPNMSTQINLIAIASTMALIYGAVKGRPFYLLPYFCLKVFDFCLSVVIAIGYLCAMPSLPTLAKQAEEQGNEMVRKQLHNMNPSALGFVTILALIAALYIKLYLLSVIWRCYRYLTLRRMSGRATISVLGAAGLAELGPDYDLHPAAAAAAASASTSSGAAGPALAPTTMALLNPPEYSKIIKEAPPVVPPRPETPPPPYSSTLNLNQAVQTAAK